MKGKNVEGCLGVEDCPLADLNGRCGLKVLEEREGPLTGLRRKPRDTQSVICSQNWKPEFAYRLPDVAPTLAGKK